MKQFLIRLFDMHVHAESFAGLSAGRQAGIWFGVCLLISVTHLTTLNLSPEPWQDEVQIVDYGRHLFERRADAAATWNGKKDEPFYAISFIGCAASELAYRLAPGTPSGPRVLALLGALFSGTMLLVLGRRMRVDPLLCLLLATAWLLDPTLVQSYRGARLEGWACGLVFAALVLLASRERVRLQHLAFAAIFLTASFLFWPTSPAMFTLTAFFLSPLWRPVTSWRTTFLHTFLLAALFASAAAVALRLIYPEFTPLDLLQSGHADTERSLQDWLFQMKSVVLEGRNSVLSSCLGIVALLGLGLRTDKAGKHEAAALAALAAVAFLVLATGSSHSHPFRGFYLVACAPLMVLVAGTKDSFVSLRFSRGLVVGVALVVLVHASISLGARNINALVHCAERDQSRLLPVVDALPYGRSNMYVGTNDFRLYYMLRGRGIVPAYMVFFHSAGVFARLAQKQEFILLNERINDAPWFAWHEGSKAVGFTLVSRPLPGYALYARTPVAPAIQ